MEVGLRVVRGPNWKWDNEDGGEGHVGTVVEIGSTSENFFMDKTVVVRWDYGYESNYRTGYDGEFDLLVFDSSPVGVRHLDVVCGSCHLKGITGTRWKCSICTDFDLCQPCYMAGQHELSHVFFRIDIPGMTTNGVRVRERLGDAQLLAKGIFAGAVVVRGRDWAFDDQDGGPGKNGRVKEIRGLDNESAKSIADVAWLSGSADVYRVGFLGKVDLQCILASSGGWYYPGHLAKLGSEEMSKISDETPEVSKNTSKDSDNLNSRAEKSVSVVCQQLRFGPKASLLRTSDMTKAFQDLSNEKLTWEKKPQNILVIKKISDDGATKAFGELILWLTETKNLNIFVEKQVLEDASLCQQPAFASIRPKLFTFVPEEDDLTDKVDLAISLGGDGTLLYTAKLFQGACIPPIMAFNLGSLGFLSPFEFDDYQEKVAPLLEGSK